MNIRQTGIGLALVAAGSLAVLWITESPLGVPGEWVWSRIPVAPGEWTLLVLGWFSAAVVGGLYIGLVAVGAIRLAAGRPLRNWPLGWRRCAAGGFAWLWVVQESPARIRNTPWASRAGFSISSGTKVISSRPGTSCGTSPPISPATRTDGPGGLPAPGNASARTDALPPRRASICAPISPLCATCCCEPQPASFRDAMDVTERTERAGRRPITPTESAALWLAALITQAVAAARRRADLSCSCGGPIRGRQAGGPPRSGRWFPRWPSSCRNRTRSFPSLGRSFSGCGSKASAAAGWRLCALAGAVFWLGMFLSLAVLPIAVAAGLLTLWESVLCSPQERTAAAIPAIGPPESARPPPVGGFPSCSSGCSAASICCAVWHWNFRNHAAFYDHYTRTYWKWLLANPIELIFAVGCAADRRRRDRLPKESSRQAGGDAAMGPYWCLTATWLVLWLSGKNMGEAARLWLILMPWPVWLAAGFFAPRLRRGRRQPTAPATGRSRALRCPDGRFNRHRDARDRIRFSECAGRARRIGARKTDGQPNRLPDSGLEPRNPSLTASRPRPIRRMASAFQNPLQRAGRVCESHQQE